MKLLFINSLKGLINKKIQITGLILLIAISATMYVAANVAINQVEDGYYAYLNEQNVEHFSFLPSFDETKLTVNDLQLFEDENLSEEENLLLLQITQCLEANTCNEQQLFMLRNLFSTYNKMLYINLEEVEKLANEKDFYYELEKSKIKINEKVYYKAIPINLDKKINKPYLLEGNFPVEENEITILPSYAEAKGLNIGDTYELNEVEYKIVGTAFASDHIYPIVSLNVPIFNEETNNIMFMTNETYDKFTGLEEKIYVARYNEDLPFNERDLFGEETIFEEDAISFTPSSIARFIRVEAIKGDLEPNKTFSNIFVNVLLVISGVIIVIIVKKRIESEKTQVGILKSMGYKASAIASSYLVYPIISVLAGSLIGYFIGMYLAEPLTNVYVSFYNVPLKPFELEYEYISRIFITPMLVLALISFLTAMLMIRKKPLFLLKEGSNIKVNFLTRLSNKILRKTKFKTRFKYSLAFRSIGKLLIVTIVSFASGLLITLVLIGNGLFSSIIDETFGNMKFDYIVAYNGFIPGENEEADQFLIIDNEISKKITDGKEVELEEEIEISLSGIDDDLKYFELKDDKGNDILELIDSDTDVLISYRISELNEIKVNDTIVVLINGEEIELTVAGIYQDYFSSSVFMNREYLSVLYSFEAPVYNQIYTTNPKYDLDGELEESELEKIAGQFSVRDLEENITSQVEAMDLVLYIVVVFAAIMSFIIMLVVANIVVEENRKNISLMKVLGYKNKQIGSIVLNIYTPFILISYLIAIPVMIKIVKELLEIFADDLEMAIPITISFSQVLIGMFAILGAYYMGMAISRRVLNKITLAEALKRE